MTPGRISACLTAFIVLFATSARHGRLDSGAWQAARIAADAIGARWREPDAGIWELEDAEWTHSRLTCVAGLRAVGAPDGPELGLASRVGLAYRLQPRLCLCSGLLGRGRLDLFHAVNLLQLALRLSRFRVLRAETVHKVH